MDYYLFWIDKQEANEDAEEERKKKTKKTNTNKKEKKKLAEPCHFLERRNTQNSKNHLMCERLKDQDSVDSEKTRRFADNNPSLMIHANTTRF